MHLSTPVIEAKALIKRLKPAVSRHASLPVLSGMLVTAKDGISARTSDLDLDLTSGLNGTVIAKGQTVVGFRAFEKFVSSLPKGGDLTIEAHKDGQRDVVTLRCDPFAITVPAGDPDEFPGTALVAAATRGKIDFAAIRSVLPAVCMDDNRPVLTGVRVEGNTYAATDGYRLHVTESPTDSGITALLPGRALKVLAHWEGVHDVRVDGRGFAIEAEGFRLYARTVQGDYPRYRDLIPAHDNSLVEFDDPDFAHTLATMAKVAKALASELTPILFREGSPVNVSIGRITDDFTLSAVVPGKATTTVAFNYRYITDLLQDAPVDRFIGEGSLKPMLLRWEDNGYKHERLLMPVRVQ